jgi:hypothetical protein
VVADDGHEVIEHDHLPHAGDRVGGGVVDAAHLAPEDRARGDGGVLHPRQPDIDAVDHRPVHLAGHVDALARLADEREPRRVLGRRIADRRQCRRRLDELAVAQAAAARGVPDLAARGGAFGHTDVPARRGGWTSIARVDAPAVRSGFQKARMEFELAVACTPSSGFA